MEHHKPEEPRLERAPPRDRAQYRTRRPVAGLPGRPDPFFRLSPAQRAEARCFGMRRGEITGRSDVTFWRYTPLILERLAGARYPLATLASLAFGGAGLA